MKLHILSDLHFEYDTEFKVPQTDADVLILAGDISPGLNGLARFARSSLPVIYVPGNHEFYGETIHALPAAMRLLARGSSIHLLDNDELQLGGVRFLGTTLSKPLRAVRRRAIRRGHRPRRPPPQRLYLHTGRPGPHADARPDSEPAPEGGSDWLSRKLAEPFDGKTVVITHHAPHPSSLMSKHEGKLINAAYASDLTHLMGAASLWIHGHTHHCVDYTVNGTRIVTNPKGYRDENRAFDPAFVVERERSLVPGKEAGIGGTVSVPCASGSGCHGGQTRYRHARYAVRRGWGPSMAIRPVVSAP